MKGCFALAAIAAIIAIGWATMPAEKPANGPSRYQRVLAIEGEGDTPCYLCFRPINEAAGEKRAIVRIERQSAKGRPMRVEVARCLNCPNDEGSVLANWREVQSLRLLDTKNRGDMPPDFIIKEAGAIRMAKLRDE